VVRAQPRGQPNDASLVGAVRARGGESGDGRRAAALLSRDRRHRCAADAAGAHARPPPHGRLGGRCRGGAHARRARPRGALRELPGNDHIPWFGDADALLDEIEEFLTGSRHAAEPDRALATVLFTDIAGSTARAATLGDRRWRELLQHHQTLVRDRLATYEGREVKTMGDGFLATFDGPAKAIRCACAIAERSSSEGVEIRAGVHTGECELIGNDVGGMAVHIGARVAAQAEPGEVLVSSTVKDLVVGSGIEFADRGSHELKGVPGEWRLLAVADHRPAPPQVAPGPRDDVAPNAAVRQRGDRTMLRLARRAPGAMRLASRAARRRAAREIAA
jgi:class 3 adenylate cyclase